MRIGIDLGGTKIAAGIVDGSTVRSRIVVLTPKSKSGVISVLRKIIVTLSKGEKIPVGLGVPGMFVGTRILALPHLAVLNGVDMKKVLGANIILENDAKCFALAEYAYGASKGRSVAVGIVLGTGIGSGVLIDGEILRGVHDAAGEIGEFVFPSGASHITYESLLCGAGIVARHHGRGGREDNARAIWNSHSRAASSTRVETEQLLGLLMINTVRAYDPDVIVLGGGLSHLPLVGAVNDVLSAHGLRRLVRQNKLGVDAGIIGASMVAR